MPWVRARALAVLRKYTDPAHPYNIADLGCGWGGAVIKLGTHYPQAVVTGYELSPWPFLIAKIRAGLRRRITIRRQDFFASDLSGYDILFCYLSLYHMRELKAQFQTLKPGSLIVSCSFAIDGWEPLEEIMVKGPIKIPVYIYRMPASSASP